MTRALASAVYLRERLPLETVAVDLMARMETLPWGKPDAEHSVPWKDFLGKNHFFRMEATDEGDVGPAITQFQIEFGELGRPAMDRPGSTPFRVERAQFTFGDTGDTTLTLVSEEGEQMVFGPTDMPPELLDEVYTQAVFELVSVHPYRNDRIDEVAGRVGDRLRTGPLATVFQDEVEASRENWFSEQVAERLKGLLLKEMQRQTAFAEVRMEIPEDLQPYVTSGAFNVTLMEEVVEGAAQGEWKIDCVRVHPPQSADSPWEVSAEAFRIDTDVEKPLKGRPEVDMICQGNTGRRFLAGRGWADSRLGPRTTNEDGFLVDFPNKLFVVVDGVGGEEDGEVAAAIVLAMHYLNPHPRIPLKKLLASTMEVMSGMVDKGTLALRSAAAWAILRQVKQYPDGSTLKEVGSLGDVRVLGFDPETADVVHESLPQSVAGDDIHAVNQPHIDQLLKAAVAGGRLSAFPKDPALQHDAFLLLAKAAIWPVSAKGDVQNAEIEQVRAPKGTRWVILTDGGRDLVTRHEIIQCHQGVSVDEGHERLCALIEDRQAQTGRKDPVEARLGIDVDGTPITLFMGKLKLNQAGLVETVIHIYDNDTCASVQD